MATDFGPMTREAVAKWHRETAERPLLVWDDVTGYYCPKCRLVVTHARRSKPPFCPACPPSTPLDERVYYALREAGFDESDAEAATRVALEAVRAR